MEPFGSKKQKLAKSELPHVWRSTLRRTWILSLRLLIRKLLWAACFVYRFPPHPCTSQYLRSSEKNKSSVTDASRLIGSVKKEVFEKKSAKSATSLPHAPHSNSSSKVSEHPNDTPIIHPQKQRSPCLQSQRLKSLSKPIPPFLNVYPVIYQHRVLSIPPLPFWETRVQRFLFHIPESWLLFLIWYNHSLCLNCKFFWYPFIGSIKIW